MNEHKIPAGDGSAELTEKRSRFIGQVAHVKTEDEARAYINNIKTQHRDARHNCWCYLLKDGLLRYSDDGEPQGTAGLPMLEVFRREGVTDVCCVVTRYFGGILLGAGGLFRMYTKAAKDALDAAGVAVVRRWAEVQVVVPYALLERVKLEVLNFNGIQGEILYTDVVDLRALLPEAEVEAFSANIKELTAGGCTAEVVGEQFRADGKR